MANKYCLFFKDKFLVFWFNISSKNISLEQIIHSLYTLNIYLILANIYSSVHINLDLSLFPVD